MDNTADIRDRLESAFRAAQAGRRTEAREQLCQVIRVDPTNQTAWLCLAGISDTAREAEAILRWVARLNPDHPKLAEAWRWLDACRGTDRMTLQSAMLGNSGQSLTGTSESQAYEASVVSGEAKAARVSEARQVEAPARQQPTVAIGLPDAHARRLIRVRWGRLLRDWLLLMRFLAVLIASHPRGRMLRQPWGAALASMLSVVLLGLLGLLAWISVSAAELVVVETPTPDVGQRLAALQPRLDSAVADGRWEDAGTVLEVMRALDPDNLALRLSATSAYYELAVQQRTQGNLEGAQAALQEAAALNPADAAVQRELRWLESYRRGLASYQTQDWPAVIRYLAPLAAEVPGYLDVIDLLCEAYMQQGIAQQRAGALESALRSFQAALTLRPEHSNARQHLAEVTQLLTPPTPTATYTPTHTPTPPPTPTPTITRTPTPEVNRQRIEVDISEQRMYVYDGDELLWKWVVSTGEPGKDTAIGTYAIRNKIENAYGSTWNLDMPWWLGIYQSGPLENGIHALPIERSTGHKLWEGYLGQRVSYGCIILSDENAKTLFDWVKIGTPVIIRW